MTEYAILWDSTSNTHTVIAKDDYDDYWYVFSTGPDKARLLEIVDALNLKERSQ